MTSPTPLLTPPLNSVRKSAPKSASEKITVAKIEEKWGPCTLCSKVRQFWRGRVHVTYRVELAPMCWYDGLGWVG